MPVVNPNKRDVTNEPFLFGTKAETLEKLSGCLEGARLCDQYFFTYAAWKVGRRDVLDKIRTQFGGLSLAVRSSAQGEDSSDNSMAGAFESFVGVPTDDTSAVSEAIENVFASYSVARDDDQVLVQPRVENVSLSGVVMSREISTGGPYFVINYDDFSGRTDTVTGGAESKTMMVLRSRVDALHSQRIDAVVRAVLELEALTNSDCLDVEFCMRDNNELFVLQVREMSMQKQWSTYDLNVIENRLMTARSSISDSMNPTEHVLGQRTIFSEMADWNPAEMIGTAPKPLAYSLYRHLITDSAWADARRRMGYRDLGDRPLMQSIAGRPYIDVRLSLNSFLPREISARSAGKLIDFQLDKLAQYRDLHDKIEFEVAVTCLDLDFQSRREDLFAAGLNESEIGAFRGQLLQMTDGFIDGGLSEIEALLARADTLSLPKNNTDRNSRQQVAENLDLCRTEGVIPFAQLARHAFVAMSMMHSLSRRELIDERSRERFFGSIRTVTSEFVHDLWALSNGSLDQAAFLPRYGHLRPGTYDILSPRYDESPDKYFGGTPTEPRESEPFELLATQESAINACLHEEGFSVGAAQLFAYMAEAIRARELCKFRFTRSLSDSLSLLVDWGRTEDLSREDLAYLSIEEIVSDLSSHALEAQLSNARAEYASAQQIRLPHLIETVDDVDVIRIPIGHPTFITSASVSAQCRLINNLAEEVDGVVVLIESADPGYDWIFSHKVAGLITKFGGANSHMGIRCAEFSIPAAIGCGDRIFQQAAEYGFVELDCSARVIRFPRRQ